MNKLLVISVLVGALAGCDQVNKVVQGECLGTCYWKIYVQHTYTNTEYVAANFGSACDGQVKTDTELSYPGQPLEVMGTDIPQI
jgi:hypothetical protein